MKPSRKREWVPELMRRFGASERQALRMVGMSASWYRYRSTAREAGGLRLRIKEITDTRVQYGYRRVHVLLRREGYQDNVKRVSPVSGGRAVVTTEAAPSQQGGQVSATEATILFHQ